MLKKLLLFAIIGAVVSAAALASAASTISLTASGDSTYQLLGIGLEGVAGFDITVNYDAAVLVSPQVTQGPLISGAMIAVNPNTPGVVRISAVTISPVKGSGQLFAMSFTRKAGGQGIKNLAARLIDMSGKPLAAHVQLTLGPGTDGGSSPSGAAGGAPAASGSGSTATGTGTTGPLIGIIAPPAAGKPAVREDRDRTPEPETGRQEIAPPLPQRGIVKAYSGPEMKSKTIYTQPSVLDGFRECKDRTMNAYLKLFDREPLIGFQQTPAIAVADGVSAVTVRFISTPERERASDLALMGGRLISSRRDPEATNTWIVTVLPERDADQVTLLVPQKDLLMVYPLTVAPKIDLDLDRSGSVNENDFLLFLRERGTKKAPVFDLNRDGVRDYHDDFIFTANYVAVQPPVTAGKK